MIGISCFVKAATLKSKETALVAPLYIWTSSGLPIYLSFVYSGVTVSVIVPKCAGNINHLPFTASLIWNFTKSFGLSDLLFYFYHSIHDISGEFGRRFF